MINAASSNLQIEVKEPRLNVGQWHNWEIRKNTKNIEEVKRFSKLDRKEDNNMLRSCSDTS